MYAGCAAGQHLHAVCNTDTTTARHCLMESQNLMLCQRKHKPQGLLRSSLALAAGFATTNQQLCYRRHNHVQNHTCCPTVSAGLA